MEFETKCNPSVGHMKKGRMEMTCTFSRQSQDEKSEFVITLYLLYTDFVINSFSIEKNYDGLSPFSVKQKDHKAENVKRCSMPLKGETNKKQI